MLKSSPYDKPELCLEIQERLIRQIRYIEKRIREEKEKQRNNRNLTSLESTFLNVKEYQKLLCLFKTIGDSLAYIYLNRWDIKPLCSNKPSGFISGKKGFKYEHMVMKKLFDFGIVAILTDLTNCLRYGDILIVENEKLDILEVKSSKTKSGKMSRQKRKRRRILDYIYNDEMIVPKNSNIVKRRQEAHSNEKTRLIELNSLIKQALKNGTGYLKVENGLYYHIAIDDKNGLEDIIKDCKSPPIVYFLNINKYEYKKYYPYALSIEDPEAIFRFYSGKLLILVIVDPSVLEKYFSEKGFKLVFPKDSNFVLEIFAEPLNAQECTEGFKVSKHFFDRIAYEFISLDWMLDEILNGVKRWINSKEIQPGGC